MDASSDLRVFVRVMDRGNFSLAASDLGITPSAVSKLISRLEDRLGVKLLERSTRRLALTPEGETFLARARRIVADIEEAEAEVARVRGAPRGKLRINSGTAFGLHQLAPALADFLARYPEIDIDLSITDRLVDLIDEQSDIAVRSGHIPEGPFIHRKIADLQRVICAAPSYLARRGTPKVSADLKGHDCIVVAGPGLNRWPFKTRAGIDIVEVRPRVKPTTPKLPCASRSKAPALFGCRTLLSVDGCALANSWRCCRTCITASLIRSPRSIRAAGTGCRASRCFWNSCTSASATRRGGLSRLAFECRAVNCNFVTRFRKARFGPATIVRAGRLPVQATVRLYRRQAAIDAVSDRYAPA